VKRAVVAGLVLALALAGCRDDDGEAINPRTEQPPPAATPVPTASPTASAAPTP
jgi:hypothetical protein